MQYLYSAAHPLVRIHSIQGRCGSYIGPESSVCERADGPRCTVEATLIISKENVSHSFEASSGDIILRTVLQDEGNMNKRCSIHQGNYVSCQAPRRRRASERPCGRELRRFLLGPKGGIKADYL